MNRLPLGTALVMVVVLGTFLLTGASLQARDTIRKHHLEDIEQALYFARSLQGTYPPYDAPSWCGRLQDPGSHAVRAQIEAALRAQNEKYANPAKPFPTDPRGSDYFYWKRSPAMFELYATLETDPTGERSVAACPAAGGKATYDYGLTSVWRESS